MNIELIADILCNDMEYYTLAEFLALADVSAIKKPILCKLWDWYWNLTPLQRFEFDYPEYEAKINELNN